MKTHSPFLNSIYDFKHNHGVKAQSRGQVLHCATLDLKEESMGSRLAFWLNNLIYLKEKPAELRSTSQAGLHLRKYQSSRRCKQFPLKSNLKK